MRMMKNTTSRCVGKIQSVHTGSIPVLTTQKTLNLVSLPCKGWVLQVQHSQVVAIGGASEKSVTTGTAVGSNPVLTTNT